MGFHLHTTKRHRHRNISKFQEGDGHRPVSANTDAAATTFANSVILESGQIQQKIESETTMMYLLAMLIPPLYFMTNKKWLPCIVTSFLLIVSFFLCCTIILIPGALILWGLCAVVAVFGTVRKALMNEHATIIAEKMAEKMAETMRQQQPPAPPPAPRP